NDLARGSSLRPVSPLRRSRLNIAQELSLRAPGFRREESAFRGTGEKQIPCGLKPLVMTEDRSGCASRLLFLVLPSPCAHPIKVKPHPMPIIPPPYHEMICEHPPMMGHH